ncbi:uncharacterized protein LOC134822393 [Bolinopsis microptera]|uniref:uncharacterized protein LOC134822393 n=1 Tax=Bolinopsis microptera TaxID=2820187 RepID=UPI0030793E7A
MSKTPQEEIDDELGDLFDEITFTQDRSAKSRLLEYFVSNPFVTAGMGATVYYLIKAGKLMGVDHMGFNQALKGRISAQAATVGFIILGAWGLKRESYLRQIENEVITEIHIADSVSPSSAPESASNETG